MKVLITGQSGTGKSTVLEEIIRRGYDGYNTDDFPEVTRLEVKSTGQKADWPTGYVDWDYYAWNWQVEGLTKLLASHKDIFIAAIVSNQGDFYHLFDKIIVLTVSDDELHRRRMQRTTHKYNDVKNIRESVQKNKTNTERMIQAGGIPVSNENAIEEVVDNILKIIR